MRTTTATLLLLGIANFPACKLPGKKAEPGPTDDPKKQEKTQTPEVADAGEAGKKKGIRWPWEKKADAADGAEKKPEQAKPKTEGKVADEKTAEPAKKKSGFRFPWQKTEEEKLAAALADAEKDKSARGGAEAAFLAECARLGAQGGTVTGIDGYTFSAAELSRLGAGGKSNCSSAVSAIADYAQQLKARGIQLVVVPVPPKAVIYPDYISKELKLPGKKKSPPRMDSFLVRATSALESRGVKVVDLTAEMISSRADRKAGGMFAKTGERWSPRAALLAAREAVSEMSTGKIGRVDGLSAADASVAYGGENLAARFITRNGTSPTLGTGGSSVALICDGNGTAWRGAGNPPGFQGGAASFCDQLAMELQTRVDLHYNEEAQNAVCSRFMRESSQGRDPLGGTRVVVWCFDALDLTSSNWRHVPLSLSFKEVKPVLELQ